MNAAYNNNEHLGISIATCHKLEARKVRAARKVVMQVAREKASLREDRRRLAALTHDSPAFYDVDGTWWWQDAAALNGGKVKIETKEEVVPAEGKPEGIKEKIMHDVNIMWGNLDGYAAKFRKGKILKYRMTEAGVPLGTIPAGHFKVRVVTHRPLVSKDFMAYQ